MTEENKSGKSRGLLGRIFRVLATGSALVLTILVAAHFTWKYSGSNQWEKVIDKDGVQVYTLKAPGQVVKRVRGVTRVKTTLGAAVAMMTQTSTEDCKSWFPGCTSIKTVKPFDKQDLTYIQLYRMRAFRPFAPRETLLKTRATQDPVTGSVLVEFMAMPDELPQNSCCFRVAHMHNTWRYTPLGDGWVEVENRMNVDLGIPYFMFNRFVPGGLYRIMTRLPKHLSNERWRNAQFDSIKERA